MFHVEQNGLSSDIFSLGKEFSNPEMKKQIKVYQKKSFYIVSLAIVISRIWSGKWNYRSAFLGKNTNGMFFPSSYKGSSFVDLSFGDAVESKLQADFTMNVFYPFS